MLKHVNITIRGKVQGVYYRANAKQMADLLGIKGFVRNQADGSVYIEAEADEGQLIKLVQWCHHGPAKAQVETVSVTDGTVQGFTSFEIRR